MFNAEQFRAKAAEYTERIEGSTDANQMREFQALAQRFTALADNEDWLAKNYDKTVHASDDRPERQADPAKIRAQRGPA